MRLAAAALLIVFGGGVLAQEGADPGDTGTASDDPGSPAGTATGGGDPGRFQLAPQIRVAAARRLDRDTTVEVYSRGLIDVSGVPFSSQSSYAGLGFGLTRRIAGFWVQASYETRGYYGRVYETWSYGAHDVSAAIGRPIDLSGPWSIAPRLAVGVRWSSDPTQNRTMLEATLPIIYQLSPEVSVFAVPRVAHQRFHEIPGGRSDTMLSFGLGLSVDLDQRVNVGLGLGYERRFSTLWSAEYARWILSPNLSLRVSF